MIMRWGLAQYFLHRANNKRPFIKHLGGWKRSPFHRIIQRCILCLDAGLGGKTSKLSTSRTTIQNSSVVVVFPNERAQTCLGGVGRKDCVVKTGKSVMLPGAVLIPHNVLLYPSESRGKNDFEKRCMSSRKRLCNQLIVAD